MLYIEGTTVKVTRGDTLYLTVPLNVYVDVYNNVTEPYEMKSGDTLTLSIKKAIKDEAYVLQKVETGSNTFHIEPGDTTELAFGKYKYDVQLDTSDGDRFTVIPPSTFELLEEVTR